MIVINSHAAFGAYVYYLYLLKVMNNLGVPFLDRMSLMEFESYAEKIYASNAQASSKVH